MKCIRDPKLFLNVTSLSMNDSIPTTIAHYEIEAALGRGSMGTVYLARDTRIGRRVALKTFTEAREHLREDEARELHIRIQREAEVSGALSHPNIVQLLEVGYEAQRVSYFAMEYVEGQSLHSLLFRKGKMPLERVLKIAADVLAGLSYAHNRGIIHRDIKPANILIQIDGLAKIADFGIARSVDSELTGSGRLLGTPNYMSPEQVTGAPLSARSDFFSLGTLLYEAISGTRPFESPEWAGILYNVVHIPAPSLSTFGVPERAAAFVDKLLSKNPDDRFASAAEAIEALRWVQQELEMEREREELAEQPAIPVAAGSTAVSRTLRRRVSTRLGLIVVTSLAAAVVLTTLVIKRHVRNQSNLTAQSENLLELNEKRLYLAKARALAEQGKYVESLALYDEYLKENPSSLIAQNERRTVVEAQRPTLPVRKPVRTRVESQREKASPHKPPPRKPSIWERLKKLTRRG